MSVKDDKKCSSFNEYFEKNCRERDAEAEEETDSSFNETETDEDCDIRTQRRKRNLVNCNVSNNDLNVNIGRKKKNKSTNNKKKAAKAKKPVPVPQFLSDCPVISPTERAKYGKKIKVHLKTERSKCDWGTCSVCVLDWTPDGLIEAFKHVPESYMEYEWYVKDSSFSLKWEGKNGFEVIAQFPLSLLQMNIPWNLPGFSLYIKPKRAPKPENHLRQFNNLMKNTANNNKTPLQNAITSDRSAKSYNKMYSDHETRRPTVHNEYERKRTVAARYLRNNLDGETLTILDIYSQKEVVFQQAVSMAITDNCRVVDIDEFILDEIHSKRPVLKESASQKMKFEEDADSENESDLIVISGNVNSAKVPPQKRRRLKKSDCDRASRKILAGDDNPSLLGARIISMMDALNDNMNEKNNNISQMLVDIDIIKSRTHVGSLPLPQLPKFNFIPQLANSEENSTENK